MSQELALVPQFIVHRGNKLQENILSVLLGVMGLSLLAQIAIPLPWTPVPITGQTFGVSLIALMWGRKRAMATFVTYLGVGALGLPVFALGKSGLSMGPTTGYLVGMAAATYWIGTLSDMGWSKTWWRSYLAAFSGSLLIFIFGAAGLSLFIPISQVWTAGVLPFLPGDFIKTLLSSYLAFQAGRSFHPFKGTDS